MMLGSKLPISKAYSIFAWAIENNNRRMQRASDGQSLILRGALRATLQGCDLSWFVALRMSGAKQGISAIPAAWPRNVVRAGERSEALAQIQEWLEKSGSIYLKVCDPFIGPDELVELLRIVLRTNPVLRVSVITSRKYQVSEQVDVPWEDAYRKRWRLASDQEPPDTRVVIAALSTGDSPIHDRWWITKGNGIRLGTSFNSIGTNKGSEISRIDETQLGTYEAEVDDCLNSTARGRNGERITYSSFTL
jgi:hypothetical protein